MKLLMLAALAGVTSLPAQSTFLPNQPNAIEFPPVRARFVRFVIQETTQGQPCLDELEIYAVKGGPNLALAGAGAKAAASSLLAGHAIHQVAHLNDGRHGNSYSWIAAGTRDEWAQIELPGAVPIARVVVSRDREGRYQDRCPARFEVRVSVDGSQWKTVAKFNDLPALPEGPLTETALLRYAFECEDFTWRKIDPTESVTRVLQQMEAMIERLAAKGVPVAPERAELAGLQVRNQAMARSAEAATSRQELHFAARLAKRRLFLREPDLAALDRVLFVKRHPYEPSHNYSVILDAKGGPGGAICVLTIPRVNGRLEPAQAEAATLFEAKDGIARDPVLSFDAQTIYFGFRKTKSDYFHLWSMTAEGRHARQITDGPFHDYFPCPLPDGGLAFMSTRCKARFLCWRPQAFVLFRMDADGDNVRPLSFANLSEWTPSLMRDGRLLWMRSEYIDKGADFGHTLWAIHPDGTHPELIFGNNTPNCYANGHEVPGSSEILCTLVSHGGDLNGPIALIDPRRGRSNPDAITNITPDVVPHYNMSWARKQCFRDPIPISRDYFLCSHAPADKFGLYVIDRWGNRELVHFDPAIGSMSPSLLRPTTAPPVLSNTAAAAVDEAGQGLFFIADVYQGLEPAVQRGAVKYIRVCQELRADLQQLSNGEYQSDHVAFQDWYATPIHKVHGPHGWPSYVAKGDLGLVPVEADGSARFHAPAAKVLYFEVLDENFNELQRMRSVVQLQPGEQRGCVGCHEHRMSAPPPNRGLPLAFQHPPRRPEPPPWGAGSFAYEKVVQPVWNAKCVRCHDAKDKQGFNLADTLDAQGVPASYRTLIAGGWVHYFDCTYRNRHTKADPLSFGTLRSKLWPLLEAGHHDTTLTREEKWRVKTWIDLNCPLWPDYQYRPNRPGLQTAQRLAP